MDRTLYPFPPKKIRFNGGMKSWILSLFALAFTTLLMTPSAHAADAPYRHVVLFKFKDSAPKEDIQKIVKAFAELKTKIPTIKSFEWGTNVSPEGLDQDFTHCFFVTFDSKEDLEAYLPHPEHKKFGELLRPQLDKVLVVDYVAKASAD